MCIQKRARESRPIIMKAVTAVVLLLPLAAASASPQRSRGRKGKVEDSSTKTWGRPNGEKQHGKHAAAFFCSLHCFDGGEQRSSMTEKKTQHIYYTSEQQKRQQRQQKASPELLEEALVVKRKAWERSFLHLNGRSKLHQRWPSSSKAKAWWSSWFAPLLDSLYLTFFSPFGFPIKIRVKLICMVITKNLCVSVQYYRYILHRF